MKITELSCCRNDKAHSENFMVGGRLYYVGRANDILALMAFGNNNSALSADEYTRDVFEILLMCQVGEKLHTGHQKYDASDRQFITEEELEELLTKQMQATS